MWIIITTAEDGNALLIMDRSIHVNIDYDYGKPN